MSLDSHSLLCFVLAGIVLHFRWLNPTKMSFGFGMALYLTCDCHLAPVLAAARHWKIEAKARLQNFGVRYL